VTGEDLGDAEVLSQVGEGLRAERQNPEVVPKLLPTQMLSVAPSH
jgi:hypothetical protein